MSQSLDGSLGKDLAPKHVETPEEVLDRGIRATSEYLQKNIPRENIRKRVRDLHEPPLPDVENSSEALSNDSEINAIAGYFGGKVWTNIAKRIGASPDRGMPGDIMRKAAEKNTNLAFEFLFSGTRKIWTGSVQAVCKSYAGQIDIVSKKDADPRSWPLELRNFDRYQTLLAASPYHIDKFKGKSENHLLAGFNTAHKIMWATLGTMPTAFQSQYQRPIKDADELNALIESGSQFDQYIASMQLKFLDFFFAVFLPAPVDTRETPGEVAKAQEAAKWKYAPLSHLVIKERGDGFALDVEKAALRHMARGIERAIAEGHFEGKNRGGCPGLAERGPDGQNLIAEMYDWYADLARAFYFPYILKKEN